MNYRVINTFLVVAIIIVVGNCAPYTEIRFSRIGNIDESKKDSVISIACIPDQSKGEQGKFYIKRIKVIAESRRSAIEEVIVRSARIEVEKGEEPFDTIIGVEKNRIQMAVIGQGVNTSLYGYLNIPLKIYFPLSKDTFNIVSVTLKVTIISSEKMHIDTLVTNRFIGRIEKGWYPLLTH